jgi:hypothetical protein
VGDEDPPRYEEDLFLLKDPSRLDDAVRWDEPTEEAGDQGSPRGKDPARLEDPLSEDDDPTKYEGDEDSLLRQGLAE